MVRCGDGKKIGQKSMRKSIHLKTTGMHLATCVDIYVRKNDALIFMYAKTVWQTYFGFKLRINGM